MMTYDNMNQPPAGDTKPTTGNPALTTTEPQPNAKPPVSANVIPAELPHPTILGTPLSRGARYIHHFEVELISDGKRLWHALSEEGQAVIAAIFGEQQAEKEAMAAHRAGQQQADQKAIDDQHQADLDKIAADRKAQEDAVAKANADAAAKAAEAGA